MKILVIDDDALVSSGIKLIIEQSTKDQPQPMVVCGIGKDGKDLLPLYQKHQPDLVLLDIRMQDVNGIEAGHNLLKLYPQAKIIYLTTFLEDDYIIEALRLGAKGYILKTDFSTLIPSIEAVIQGQSVFGNEIISRIPQYFNQQSNPSIHIPELTERENRLLEAVAQGLNNKEISDLFHFSEGTIRNYISDLLLKLDLRDRTQLAIYYYKHIQPHSNK